MGGGEAGGRGVTLWFLLDATPKDFELSYAFPPRVGGGRQGTGRGRSSGEVPLYTRLISIAGLFKLPPGGLT